MWTGLLLRSDAAECEGAFKSTMLKKDSFVLTSLGTVFPLLRPSSNHFGLLATSLTAHYHLRLCCVCLYAA